jgi:hypothetical protein
MDVLVFPSDFAFANTGDSSMFFRIKYETPTITIEIKMVLSNPKDQIALVLGCFLLLELPLMK